MLFPTPTFAIFFALVLPLSWALMRHPRGWRPFIVGASYLFYAAWDWRFVFLLAGSTVGNQLVAVAIHRESRPPVRKALLALGIAGNLAVLGWFKYVNFFLTSTHNGFERAGIDVPTWVASVVLPVGISFFTFMAMSYLVDIYRGTFHPTTFAKFAVFLSFFPHLVAGPIVRPAELIPQFRTPRDPRRVDASWAFFLIAGGLFKKLVLANELGTRLVDPVFGAPGQHSSPELLCAVYGYAVQIWADFSGYTDIAIGIALLLGFRFPQNFNSPYAATSLQDFWHRWHMTLSRWLRDYVYIPLGGNRRGRLVTYRNLMLTMLVGGLWHGAGWTFIAWGALWGAGLVGERAWRERRAARGLPQPEPGAAGLMWRRVATFNFACLGWIFFRSDSFGTATDVITGLFTRWSGAAPLVTTGVLAAIAVGIGWQYVPAQFVERLMASFSGLRLAAQASILAVTMTVVAAMGPQGVAPFIYFRF